MMITMFIGKVKNTQELQMKEGAKNLPWEKEAYTKTN